MSHHLAVLSRSRTDTDLARHPFDDNAIWRSAIRQLVGRDNNNPAQVGTCCVLKLKTRLDGGWQETGALIVGDN